MTVDDVSAVERLESRAVSHPWPAGAFRHELEVNPHAVYFVALPTERGGADVDAVADTDVDTGATMAGFAGLWMQHDEAHISQMAVDPACRRRGIGGRLLARLIDHAIAAGAAVLTLEVRVGNRAARALYDRFGFVEVGVRRAYYADNDEDAVIMTTPATDDPAWRARVAGLGAGRESRPQDR